MRGRLSLIFFCLFAFILAIGGGFLVADNVKVQAEVPQEVEAVTDEDFDDKDELVLKTQDVDNEIYEDEEKLKDEEKSEDEEELEAHATATYQILIYSNCGYFDTSYLGSFSSYRWYNGYCVVVSQSYTSGTNSYFPTVYRTGYALKGWYWISSADTSAASSYTNTEKRSVNASIDWSYTTEYTTYGGVRTIYPVWTNTNTVTVTLRERDSDSVNFNRSSITLISGQTLYCKTYGNMGYLRIHNTAVTSNSTSKTMIVATASPRYISHYSNTWVGWNYLGASEDEGWENTSFTVSSSRNVVYAYTSKTQNEYQITVNAGTGGYIRVLTYYDEDGNYDSEYYEGSTYTAWVDKGIGNIRRSSSNWYTDDWEYPGDGIDAYAVANPHYHFSYWSESPSGLSTITRNLTITAIFEPDK